MLVGFSSQWTSPRWIATVYWIRPSVLLCHLECLFPILMVFLTLILRFPEVRWMSQAGYPRFVDLLTRYLFWNFYLMLFVMFAFACRPLGSRVLALARPLARSFHNLKLFLWLEQFQINIFIPSCYSCLSRQDLTTWYVINKINTTWSNSFPLVNIAVSGAYTSFFPSCIVDSSKCFWWIWWLAPTLRLAARADAEISLDEAKQSVRLHKFAQLPLDSRARHEHVWCARYFGPNLGLAPADSKRVCVW